jgi:hypothetical protein
MRRQEGRIVCARCGKGVDDATIEAVADDRQSWRCPCGSWWVTSAATFSSDDEERERKFQAHLREEVAVQELLRRRAAEDAELLFAAAEAGQVTGRVFIEAIESSAIVDGQSSRRHTDIYLSALVLELAAVRSR